MFKKILLAVVTGVSLLSFSTFANAQEVAVSGHDGHAHMHHSAGHDHNALSGAPISMMGDHIHGKGDWMVSYRFQHMRMDGNRDGTDSLSPEEIVSSAYANRFSGVAGQPGLLRVVPTEMTMNMHMVGGMYAPTDWLTLMAMGMWMEKDMSHITFQGMMGTNRLGTFKTQSEGWGDTVLSGLVKLYEHDNTTIHANLGLSIPTGSIKEEGNVLTPMNMRPRLRLPYAMQLGTGTYDFHPGLTYNGSRGDFSWGAQYKAEIRLEDENDQGYAWGDKHALTAWGAYQWAPWISTSLRLTGSTEDDIDGIDPNIVAPVQTADPDNYGGERVEAGLGVNLMAPSGMLKGHRLAFEAAAPVYEDLNGPQMERDYTFTLGWQKAF